MSGVVMLHRKVEDVLVLSLVLRHDSDLWLAFANNRDFDHDAFFVRGRPFLGPLVLRSRVMSASE